MGPAAGVIKAFGDMSSALKSWAKGSDSAASAAARLAGKARAGRAASAAARTSSDDAATAAAQARNDPDTLVRNIDEADNLRSTGENLTQTRNAKTGEAVDLDAAGRPKTQADIIDAGKTKLSVLGVDITPMRVIGFATFTTLVTLAAIYFTATANKTLTITNIEFADATHINVSYIKPNDDFTLRVNDELEFKAVTPAPTVPALAPQSRKITAIISDTTVQITLPLALTSIAGANYNSPPAGSPAGPPSWSTSWGTAVSHTTFENQFFGAVGDGVAFVAGAAAAAVAGAVPGLESIIYSLGDLAGAAGAAASGALCATVPILCDTTMWSMIGGAIVLLIIFFVIIPAVSGGGKKGQNKNAN